MHNAPPVVYPVGRFVWAQAVGWGVSALSALGLAIWQVQSASSFFTAFGAWVFWAACVLGARVWAPRELITQGRLSWTGEAWFYQRKDGVSEEEAQSVRLSVGLDVGSGFVLWVRFMGPMEQFGRWRCACFSQAQMPSNWHGFRCAVYSHVHRRKPTAGPVDDRR